VGNKLADIPVDRRIEILDSLGSTKCEGCGKAKQSMKSHCRACYFRLPKDLQRKLYERFGSGYEEAFEESLAYLKTKKGDLS